ncbi:MULTISPECIES: hypothetical protein [unclassified Curtobacterium]|uniref:hypothetical protein n=1 Tax=unclassified Curtobacterium TaxID=257496 RepID=UPI0011145302|nr:MULTISPECIES: hypothetical protein [unclassified Curtobacterium]WIA97848.1 hypothetical protein QOL16_05520 [Curtobacterium sp. MCBA15_004]WIB01121.1 hypothetical protein QOL15_05370 [Curtobacterium sp. MCBA15_012]
MTQQARQHRESEPKLEDLGLDPTMFRDAASRGLDSALSRTGFANPGAQSNDLYQDLSEDIRRRLGRMGWTVGTVNNQRRIVHPDGLLAIVVTAAKNVGVVGDPLLVPVTTPKGPVTRKSIDRYNRLTGQGFFQFDGVPDPVRADPDELAAAAPLWFLMHHLVGRTLLLELAEPIGYRPTSGKVDTWGRRFPIDPISFDEDDGFPDDTEGPADLDIPITRR